MLLLSAFVFTIPFEEIVTVPGVGSITRLLGVVLLVGGALSLVERGRLRLQRPMLLVLVAIVHSLWGLLTYFWSFEPTATIQLFVSNVQLVAFVWLVGEFGRSREARSMLMQAFVLGNYVAVAIVTYVVVVVRPEIYRDLGRFNANDVATIASLAVPMAMLLFVEQRGRVWGVINAVYPIVAVLACVVVASRSGFVILLITLAAVPFAMVRATFVQRALAAVLVVVLASASFALVPRVLPDVARNLERLAETGTELATGTLTGRTTIWRATLDLFVESPLVGVGAGAASSALVATNLGQAVAVHNAFLSVAAGGGLVGLGLYLAMIATSFASALSSQGPARPFVLLIAIALVVAMLPANIETRKATWFCLVLVATMRPWVFAPSAQGAMSIGGAPMDHQRARHIGDVHS